MLDNGMTLIILAGAISILIQLGRVWFQYSQKAKIRKQIRGLMSNTITMTPKQFQQMRNKRFKGNKHYASDYNFAGIYVLHNTSKKMYYIGQGKNVLDRVNSHFAGRGNGDVYADYKYGDKWTIQMLALDNSDFYTLNDLERHAIEFYNSYHKGYNKTRGNK